MPFLLAEILNFQGSTHLIGVGSLSYLIMKSRKYKSEKEKNAIDKGLIAYLFTSSFIVSWIVYRKNNNDRL